MTFVYPVLCCTPTDRETDRSGLSFGYGVLDRRSQFKPLLRLPEPDFYEGGGVFSSDGQIYELGRLLDDFPRPGWMVDLLDAYLGGFAYAVIHPGGRYEPSVSSKSSPDLEAFKHRLQKVLFQWNARKNRYRDYTKPTADRLQKSTTYRDYIEVARWHIKTDGGVIERPGFPLE